jgi:alkylation response protein AidB-like acyl-CoA dehydrogenase
MRFDLTADQREIKRTASDLLGDRVGPAALRAAAESRAYDPGLWTEIVELGWPATAIPERFGGLGLGLVELALLLEECGFACAASPLLPTTLAALMIAEAGSEEQRERWLPSLAAGEATATIALARSGDSAFAPDADSAALIVWIGSSGGILVERERASVEPVATIDPTRAYARVSSADGTPLPGDVAGALDRALIGVAAELVGVGQRALDVSVAYVKERRQFGVPIGSFQAVAHTAAEMLRDVEGARAVTYAAAWAADADAAELSISAATAKAAASDAARSATGSAIQLHGGVGFAWESDVHWLYKRAQLAADLLGGGDHHRRRIIEMRMG